MSSLGFSGSAFANEMNSDAEMLAELNPGMTEADVIAQAEELAEKHGVPVTEVITQQLEESRASAAESSNVGGFALRSSGGGGGTVILGNGSRVGDVFWSPASTLFIQHGHSGIYYSMTTVIEAPGTGQNSRATSPLKLQVGSGAQKQVVETTQANRNAAANYAFNYLLNKPYNMNFANNKYVPASSYNCSQLVWGADKKATGIDLDSNGGYGVYPADIRNSSLTTTYVIL